MSVRIVTHVFARDLPQYAVFLRAQLSSLVLHKPKVRTAITVCLCSEEDPEVVRVCNEFRIRYPGLGLQALDLSLGDLFRRSIGRNRAALRQGEDLVWFTDVDYVFGPGCIDELWRQEQNLESFGMVWPNSVLINPDYEAADKFWQVNRTATWCIEPDTTGFVEKKYNRAIGGVQVVRGSFAREFGYLRNFAKWQTPQSPEKPFPCFRDDIAFRSVCQKQGVLVPVSVPNLIRLRHSRITYKSGNNSAAPSYNEG